MLSLNPISGIVSPEPVPLVPLTATAGGHYETGPLLAK